MVTNINPQDLTGKRKAELAAKFAEEQKEAAKRSSMITAQASEVSDEVVDLSGDDSVLSPEDVEVRVPKKELRVNTLLENVTIGWGTNYTFEPNQKYKVTKDVYDYLDEKGFVWH
jgi:bisphosphoglycerate-dependent phosphoglycerate mutase